MDEALSVTGANAPPNVQVFGSGRPDSREGSTGPSFQDELRAQETRHSPDRTRKDDVKRSERPSHPARDEKAARSERRNRTEKAEADQKADASRTSSADGSTPTDQVQADPVDDGEDPQNRADQAAADGAIDPQAQAAAAAAVQPPVVAAQDEAEPQASEMIDAAVTAMEAAPENGAAEVAAAGTADVPDFASTAADNSAQNNSPVNPAKANPEAQPVAQSQQSGTASTDGKSGEEGAPSAAAKTEAAPQATGTPAAGLFDTSAAHNRNTGTTSAVNTEPARLAEARAQDVIAQVSRSMETVIKSGQNYMKIQLFPEDLGRIDLRLVSGNQGLVVTMMAEQSSTGKILESQLASIRQSLTDAGIQLAHLGIGPGGSQQMPGQQSGRWEAPKHSSGWGALNAAGDTTMDIEIARRSTAANGVDYRV